MSMYELIPQSGRKSFNHKCLVIETDKMLTLVSYETEVAHYTRATRELKVNGYYSATTAIHLAAFLSHIGYSDADAKKIIADAKKKEQAEKAKSE